MNSYLKGWLLAGCLCSALNCEADQSINIRIAEPQIEGLIQADGQGAYQRLVEAALRNSQYQIETQFYPFKRAMAEFSGKQFDCLYSQTELAEKILGRDNVISSRALSRFGFYFFVRRGSLPPTSPEALKDKRVVGILGQIDYYQDLLPDLHVVGLPSEQQALGMLSLGRADVYIAALPDLLPRLDEVSVNTRHPLLVLEDRLTCHRTSKNEQFLHALDQRLQDMKASGETEKVLGAYYFDPETLH